MDPRVELAAVVKKLALETGFARVGIAPAGPTPHAELFDEWLRRGWHGEMSYLARDAETRRRPDRLVPGARSVLCLVAPYAPVGEDAPANPSVAFLARYARGRDYHKVLKKRCHVLMDRIREVSPDFEGRAFVDSVPLSERSLAAAAGVGWIGRNGCLIVPGLGSYVLLAEIICNLDLPPDAPLPDGCGPCRQCVFACPTGAIADGPLVDARRCLSCLTIEHRGEIAPELRAALGRRVFGCDACQEACPHNRGVPPGEAELTGERRVTLAEILAWREGDWDAFTRGAALRRAKLDQWLRNAALAAGNSGDTSLIGPLRRLLAGGAGPADAVAWALARLGAGG
ncbi:MAG TPA: tRNA epoxyqueuosine(34) reductase QueG [Phycisphaerae bacterium]|nr:tRNA epoxyqueuosine(34) reductase QueG [Phycisphaerae bacterium]